MPLMSCVGVGSGLPPACRAASTCASTASRLSADSKDAVDAEVEAARKAGGKPDPTPTQDMGGMMYGRSYEDPDGHIWEVMWMDAAAAEQGAGAFEDA